MKKSILVSTVLVAGLVMTGIPSAFADGCAPGEPCWEKYKPRPVRREAVAPAPVVREVAPAPVMLKKEPVTLRQEIVEDVSEYSLLVSAGANVMYYNCHDTQIAGGIYGDVRKEGLPLNFRTGIEISNLNATDFFFQPDSAFFQEEPDFVLVRIPISLEYVIPVSEETEVLVGGGIDLIQTSGRGSDGDVGGHLEARLVQDLGSDISASVGTGYLWANTDTEGGENLDLKGAYTGASIGYKF